MDSVCQSLVLSPETVLFRTTLSRVIALYEQHNSKLIAQSTRTQKYELKAKQGDNIAENYKPRK